MDVTWPLHDRFMMRKIGFEIIETTENTFNTPLITFLILELSAQIKYFIIKILIKIREIRVIHVQKTFFDPPKDWAFAPDLIAIGYKIGFRKPKWIKIDFSVFETLTILVRLDSRKTVETSLATWSCLKLIESLWIHQMELVQVFRKYVRETNFCQKFCQAIYPRILSKSTCSKFFLFAGILNFLKNELKSAFFQVSDILPNYMVTIFKPDLRVLD